MVAPTVSKLINKLAWTARRFGRSAPIEVLYQGGSKERPEYIKRIRGPVYLEPLHGYAITAEACWWKRPWTRTSRCRGVGVTTACRRGRAVADAAEPMVFRSEGGSPGAAILNQEGTRGGRSRSK
jgi:hypothetical protein